MGAGGSAQNAANLASQIDAEKQSALLAQDQDGGVVDVAQAWQVLVQLVNEEEFKNGLAQFQRTHCRSFEDQAENKLEYTIIHCKYMQLIEAWLEARMIAYLPGFSMAHFLTELPAYIQAGGVAGPEAEKTMELLSSCADFGSFKEMMMDASARLLFAAEAP
eukprot:TRINITY_DN88080_c0_g1_i1.p1 TRINITY_DN88080_c0_g1~~TRINITY_DN88080_c0_g1_i1.p1  ORF type:complete len:162 (+),score=41.78 TRINITY_DN88080_c0_g1_i1:150-635(+)